MIVHQNIYVLASRIITLGMVRGIVCEMKGKQLNWVAYTEWTNAEQFQCAKTKYYVREDGSQDMLFDEGEGFDEEELDIKKASE
jgi:hypothetical protein